MLGHDGAGEGNRVRHQQVRSARRGSEVCIAIPHIRDKEFSDEDLRPTLRIHDAADHGMNRRGNVGPDRVEGNPLAIEQRVVKCRCGEKHIVASQRKLTCQTEIGVNVSQRTEAGDDDALPHAWSHGASIGPEAD